MEEKVFPQGADPDSTRGQEEVPDEEQGGLQGDPPGAEGLDTPCQDEDERDSGAETPEEAEGQEDEVAQLKEALERQREEKEEYLRLLQRTKADFENYRRRIEKERRDIIKRANERLLLELLPVLDNLERALQVQGEEATVSAIIEGVKMIYRQFLEVLKREGVRPIEAQGEPFNPEIHEAVLEVEDSTAEAGTVVEEVQRGYMLHDRVLRPSMVKVAKG